MMNTSKIRDILIEDRCVEIREVEECRLLYGLLDDMTRKAHLDRGSRGSGVFFVAKNYKNELTLYLFAWCHGGVLSGDLDAFKSFMNGIEEHVCDRVGSGLITKMWVDEIYMEWTIKDDETARNIVNGTIGECV
jgi:hypothetical protein